MPAVLAGTTGPLMASEAAELRPASHAAGREDLRLGESGKPAGGPQPHHLRLAGQLFLVLPLLLLGLG